MNRLAGLAALTAVGLASAGAGAVVGGAVLQGGRAPIFGAIRGAVIIQLVKYTLLANGVEDEVALIVKAVIIVLAVYLQQGRKE